jgi:hypothetical protein
MDRKFNNNTLNITKEQCNSIWGNHYNDTFPITWNLKNIFKEKWCRIHNLLKAKRFVCIKI